MLIPKIFLILAFFVNLGLGFLVFTKTKPRKRINLVFSALAWSSAGWILSVFMIYYFGDTPSILFWGKMSFATSSIIPSCFLYFSIIFPKEKHIVGPLTIFTIFFPTFIFCTLSFTSMILQDISLSDWGFQTIYGSFHTFFSIYLVGYIIVALVFLTRNYRASIGISRLQIKYCFLGMLFTSMLSVTTNLILPILGSSKFSPIGPTFTVIMVGFTTYSIVKHRLMDINIVLKKGTTYVLLTFLIFVPSAILVFIGQKFFFQKINYLFSALILFLFLVVTIFFQRIKPGTEKAVEQLLFKGRYDYRETLGKFSKAMVTILDLQSLSRRIIDTITQTMGVEKASLFLWNEEKGGYDLFESKNLKLVSPTPLIPKGDPLPHYLQKIGEIIIREELVKGADIPELNSVANKMFSLESEVSIPLLSKGELIGMINLGYKLNKDIYSQEDIELLNTLANQTAIVIENARLYEDLKKSKSYMRRADRLASLGILTAGLAHEIRNPLVAIKTFIQLLPERLEDEEFRNHFLNIASAEVDRISLLINELLDFARPSDPKLEMEDVNSILEGMVLLVSTESKKKHIQVIKEYAQDLPPVSIDREQIKQVFLNILLNAIEAITENGRITVKTRSFIKSGGESFVQIEFTDTGCGITPEYLEDIFNPFFSTKDKGSGLGLSISNQIVQDHKGYIAVESQLEKGSSFFINLPLNQDYPKRRRNDFENNRNIFNSFEQQ